MKNSLLLQVVVLGLCLVFGGRASIAGDIVSSEDLLSKLAPPVHQASQVQKAKFRGLKLSGGSGAPASAAGGSPGSAQTVATASPQAPPPPPSAAPSSESAAKGPSVDIYIYFKSGTSQIADARSWKQLDEVGKALGSQAMQGCLIEIGGHTDSIGDAGYNMTLSNSRAKMVRQYLESKYQLPALKIKGYGESQPVASNDTDAGRSLNRRVAITRLN